MLRAHVARANPQWRDLQHEDEALVVFQGAEHYISPSWYETKRETHKVVPTWNYLIVQARGRPRVIDDAAWLRAQIEALTRDQEAGAPSPGRSATRRRISSRCRCAPIVGVEIAIADIRGQVEGEPEPQRGRPRGRGRGARADGDAQALAMAEIVRQATK